MDTASKIREKTDIVALISEFVPLKKAGTNFKANCPFHNEKTPSFVVSPQRQIWHCFGCGKGGDCFTFLMEYEHIEFVDALKTLGKKAGIEVEVSSLERGISGKKEKIYQLNKKAADFYHYILTSHNAGKKALEYLKNKRNIKDKVIETFCLGFSPKTADALTKYLIQKKDAKKEDLLDAGLSAVRNGKIVDFFFNRIMFPLFDHRGNIIGFSGRILEETVQISKYINTKDTIVYHKGDVFFGLNTAKEDIKREGSVIIMEGEFDVISSFQAGIGNAVAVKGTALTENQVILISRFVSKVTLCFDKDAAGFEALKRSIPILDKRGLSIYVLDLEGKDPDETIQKDLPNYKKGVMHPLAVYDFLIDEMVKRFDKSTVEGKKKLSEELIPILANIENEILKEHFLKKISNLLEVSLESVYRQVEKIQKKDEPFLPGLVSKQKQDRREVLEQYVLALIIQSQDTEKMFTEAYKFLSDFSFQIPSFGKLWELLFKYFEDGKQWKTELFIQTLAKELLSAFDSCLLLPLPKFEHFQDEVKDLYKSIEQLKELSIRSKIKEISSKIKGRESNANESELKILEEELSRYLSLLSS